MTRSRGLVSAFVLLVSACVASDAAAQQMRCRSRDYKYAFCHSSVPIARASVRDRKSSRPCILGQTWGYQRNGIWVDHGCDAEFDVQYYGGPTYPGPGYPGPGYPGGGWYPDNPGWGNQGGAPGWAVGTWRSEVAVAGGYSTITVYPNGQVTWTTTRGSSRGYWSGVDGIRLYNNRVIAFDRQGSRARVALPGWGVYRFRRVY